MPPEEVFAAVTEEVGRLLSLEYAALGRYESDGMVSVATWGRTSKRLPVGGRWTLVGKNVSTLVFETGRPARIDGYADVSGPFGVQRASMRSAQASGRRSSSRGACGG